MEELEEIRKKLKKTYIKIIIITILVVLPFLVLIRNFAAFPFIFLFAFVGAEIAIIITGRKTRQEYRDTFKKVFVVNALKSKFTDLYYRKDRGMSYQKIADTNMIYMGNRFYSEDYISAKYKGIKFEQGDVYIEEEHTSTDSEGHTTTSHEKIFQGRWMIFDFNKNFKADVQVVEKGFCSAKVNTNSFFKNKKNKKTKDNLFKKIYMESESFNKKFNVYAQNEHDAFYILTPSIMSKIEKLYELNKGKLLLCFVNNRLHIGIYDNKDSFEPGTVFKKIDEEKTLKRISNDIEMITQFVDELNLDNSLFKKEV